MTPELGIIEGYFGRSWSWADRHEVICRLAPAGYTYFHYAPKIDSHLRRNWRNIHDEADTKNLRCFVEHCASHRVRSGVGLSPYGAHVDFDRETKEKLREKIAWLDMLESFVPGFACFIETLEPEQDIAEMVEQSVGLGSVFTQVQHRGLGTGPSADVGSSPARRL